MAIFGQKGQKRGKYRENPVFRGFGPFWALLGPGRQGFYINPWLGGPGAARGLGQASWPPPEPGGVWGPRPGIPDLGIRRSLGAPSPGGGPSGVPEPRPGVPGSPALWGFTSTPRAGAPRSRRGSRGPPGWGSPTGARGESPSFWEGVFPQALAEADANQLESY